MAAATFQASVRDKGQLTLPAGVREALGVSPGDELEFEINDAGCRRGSRTEEDPHRSGLVLDGAVAGG